MTTNADVRLQLLHEWLAGSLALTVDRIAPASADASFRRYFRIWRGVETFIAMDAPPDKQDLGPYVKVARLLAETGVHVPRVLAEERNYGFLLITDLGQRQYLHELSNPSAGDPLYEDAMIALCRIQSQGTTQARTLPPYDRAFLEREMNLMPEWFCARHLDLTLTAQERELLAQSFGLLADAALEQPQVFMHRDYHSRNLMVCPGENPGILDFQDAVCGPVTYDLVSLLRDVYIEWPQQRVHDWMQRYRAMAGDAGVEVGSSEPDFSRWFDLMGVQRHLKILGIFARLFHRDGKPDYLSDLPLTLRYLCAICRGYPELEPLGQFLDTRVAPALAARSAEAPQ